MTDDTVQCGLCGVWDHTVEDGCGCSSASAANGVAASVCAHVHVMSRYATYNGKGSMS